MLRAVIRDCFAQLILLELPDVELLRRVLEGFNVVWQVDPWLRQATMRHQLELGFVDAAEVL